MTHYIFQHMSTIIMLSPEVTQFYKDITSPLSTIMGIQRDIILSCTKGAQELQKENLRDEQGGGRIGS